MTPSPFQSSTDAPDGPFGPHTEAPEAIKVLNDIACQPYNDDAFVEVIDGLPLGELRTLLASHAAQAEEIERLKANQKGSVQRRRAEKAEAKLVESEEREARLIEAAQELLDARFATYKARNGRDVGVQDDNGEMVWLVPHEPIDQLAALTLKGRS